MTAVDDVDLALQIHGEIVDVLRTLDWCAVGIVELLPLDDKLVGVANLYALFPMMHAVEYHAVNSGVGIDGRLIELRLRDLAARHHCAL